MTVGPSPPRTDSDWLPADPWPGVSGSGSGSAEGVGPFVGSGSGATTCDDGTVSVSLACSLAGSGATFDSVSGLAHATPGEVAIAKPTPRATASAPTRPMCLEQPVASCRGWSCTGLMI